MNKLKDQVLNMNMYTFFTAANNNKNPYLVKLRMLWTQIMFSYKKMFNVCNVEYVIIKKSQCRKVSPYLRLVLAPFMSLFN